MTDTDRKQLKAEIVDAVEALGLAAMRTYCIRAGMAPAQVLSADMAELKHYLRGFVAA